MKRYLKKIEGIDKPIVMKNPPVFGEVPTFNRGIDFLVDGVWQYNTGTDVLRDIDPFNDGSLYEKWLFNSNIGLKQGLEFFTDTTAVIFTDNDSEDFSLTTNSVLATVIPKVPIVLTDNWTISLTYKSKQNVTAVNDYVAIANGGTVVKNQIYFKPSLVAGEAKFVPAFYDYLSGIDRSIIFGESSYGAHGVVFKSAVKTGEINTATITYDGSRVTCYDNGVLIGIADIGGGYTLNRNSNSFLRSTAMEPMVFEVYDRVLTEVEVKSLVNHQLDNIQPHTTPISYIQENGKLLELDIGKSGDIIGLNYDKFHPELLTNTAQFKELLAKEAIVPGSIRTIQHFTRNIYASSATVGVWAIFHRSKMVFNTDKYNYIVVLNVPVYVNNIGAGGGADINISIGSKNIVTTGHLGNGTVVGSTYYKVNVKTPLITDDLVGEFEIFGQLSPYNTNCNMVHNDDNAGGNSGKQTSVHKTDVTVYEIYKGVPGV